MRGRAVAVDGDGRFRLSVPLAPGVNFLDIIAISPDGLRTGKTLTLTQLLPLEDIFLTITQPDEQDSTATAPTIQLWGRTASYATVAVNGIGIPVDQLGIFSTTITLQLGLNTINVIATNPKGDTLQRAFAVTCEAPQPKPESTEGGGRDGGAGDKGPGGATVPVDFGSLASVNGLRWSCRTIH